MLQAIEAIPVQRAAAERAPGHGSSTTSVYVASADGFAGKSTIALGMLEQLSKMVARVGVFRPIVNPSSHLGQHRDEVLDLLTSHEACVTTYDGAMGVSYDDMHADPDGALDRIVDRYHAVAETCDAVVVVGSDFTDVATPTEFSVNARIAANIGAPVLLVVNGSARGREEMRTAVDVLRVEIAAQHAVLLGVVANRCLSEDTASDAQAVSMPGSPGYALPDEPLLTAPSVAQLMTACEGVLVAGDEALLQLEARDLLVAGMTLPNVLDRLTEGCVVVAASDRPEVVLGVLVAHASPNFPQIAAIVLIGGQEMPPQVMRLIEGLAMSPAIIATELSTHATVTRLAGERGRLSKDSARKLATAIALFNEHVDGDELAGRLELTRSETVTPLMFEHHLLDRAVADRRHIVLPEGEDDRILLASDTLLRRGVADLTLLGSPAVIQRRAAELGVDITRAQVVDPAASEHLDEFAEYYHQQRRHKGVHADQARSIVTDVSYFGTLMVQLGKADGMVSGAMHTTAQTIRPSLEVIRTVPGVSTVSSVFFMCLPNQVLVYGDCAVVPDPTSEQLADIAIASAATAAALGVEPRVAMLSYSTGSSGSGSDVEKVVRATAIVRERAPELAVEGPIQYDAAIDSAVAKAKLPSSKVAGQATVFVFPDLNTGNNTYKAVQRSAKAVAVGPVLQGLRKPVNDLSRGATVRDIVNTVAITAIQAQHLQMPKDAS